MSDQVHNHSSRAIPKKVLAAVFATGLLSFCGVIIETAMNITFPTLMREFHVTTDTVQWMTSSYLLVVAITVPLSAILKASFHTRSLFLTANLLFITGVLIDAFAPAFPFLVLGRAVQGIGTGVALPLMFNIILERVPASTIGLMMGLANLITGIAPAIGPTFGGVVVSSLGWRWVFYFLLPFLILSLLLGLWGITKSQKVLKPQSVDAVSFLAIVLLFGGLVVGFSNLAHHQFVSPIVGGAFLVGLLGLVLLVWRSLTIAQPILQLRLLSHKRFSGHLLGFFLTQLVSLGYAFLLPNYVQLTNHQSALFAGMLVLPAGFAGALFAPLGGRVMDAVGPRKPILTGASLMAISLMFFTLAGGHLSNWYIAGIYIIYMAGMGACMGCVMTSALMSFEGSDRTQGNAIMNTLQQFAGAMGTSIAATIVAQSQAHAGLNQAATTALGTHHAFIFLLALAILILADYWLVVPRRAVSGK